MNWKPINGYEGLYEISDQGQLRSLKRKQPALLKPILHHTGYYTCRLYKNQNWTEFKIHRLVAAAFVPGNNVQVNHINNIRTDNRAENLEWCSNRENATHRSKLKPKSSKYTGVTFCRFTGKWAAQYFLDGKLKKVGRYKTEDDAYSAYKVAIDKAGIVNKYS